jgi:hypothetical protein
MGSSATTANVATFCKENVAPDAPASSTDIDWDPTTQAGVRASDKAGILATVRGWWSRKT